MFNKWVKTTKGQARRLYDKFKKRWEEKGYTVKFSAKQFYPIFLNQECCGICGGQFSDIRRGLHKSVRVKDSLILRQNKIINPEDLLIVHYACGCSKSCRCLKK